MNGLFFSLARIEVYFIVIKSYYLKMKMICTYLAYFGENKGSGIEDVNIYPKDGDFKY